MMPSSRISPLLRSAMIRSSGRLSEWVAGMRTLRTSLLVLRRRFAIGLLLVSVPFWAEMPFLVDGVAAQYTQWAPARNGDQRMHGQCTRLFARHPEAYSLQRVGIRILGLGHFIGHDDHAVTQFVMAQSHLTNAEPRLEWFFEG